MGASFCKRGCPPPSCLGEPLPAAAAGGATTAALPLLAPRPPAPCRQLRGCGRARRTERCRSRGGCGAGAGALAIGAEQRCGADGPVQAGAVGWLLCRAFWVWQALCVSSDECGRGMAGVLQLWCRGCSGSRLLLSAPGVAATLPQPHAERTAPWDGRRSTAWLVQHHPCCACCCMHCAPAAEASLALRSSRARCTPSPPRPAPLAGRGAVPLRPS